ncbi:F0F1 ATP synthase subunit B [Vibrio sp. 10N.286.49.B3]|uniref:F0F1 ATP synthase subunit B n=1 Tax=Vibrio sp. 10N.286.49.B3 TaxID=1880855 RepID=UPI000C86334D|nr:F0F1 ATP synthase subunit B [Vibrio sp. 10N.286.49.B3]PMH46819.1 F0F1 ATP synthase subunit B [Vibrio sp. 10N.286.49.B3]
MNLNASMFGQAISFVIFVWLCMKYVWPPLTAMLDERQKEIAQGLRHTENASKELALAKENGAQLISDAKESVNKMLEQGSQRRQQIIDEAVTEAEQEKARIIAKGKTDIEAERQRVRRELKAEMADLVIESAEKLINRNLDTQTNRELVNKFISEI